ncbi:MAG: HigA family addiction module antidote protein [Proteobacteria bacterium]|nr:HigA family addiction module antidote protein [Pseudomonadota bacterium]
MRERKRCPTHPGRILKDLYMEPLKLTNTKVAEILGVSRKAVSAIINERKSVTPEMALRLSKAFPNSTPESWANLQNSYDLWQAAHKTNDWKKVEPVPAYVYEKQESYGL